MKEQRKEKHENFYLRSKLPRNEIQHTLLQRISEETHNNNNKYTRSQTLPYPMLQKDKGKPTLERRNINPTVILQQSTQIHNPRKKDKKRAKKHTINNFTQPQYTYKRPSRKYIITLPKPNNNETPFTASVRATSKVQHNPPSQQLLINRAHRFTTQEKKTKREQRNTLLIILQNPNILTKETVKNIHYNPHKPNNN